MMLRLARAIRANCAAGEDPAAGPNGPGAAARTPPAACAGARAAGAPEEAELPCEQPASSRAAPDISPAHVSAVVRSGRREARARAVVFMPLGRARPVAWFR